jgi:hypothetical protein
MNAIIAVTIDQGSAPWEKPTVRKSLTVMSTRSLCASPPFLPRFPSDKQITLQLHVSDKTRGSFS